LSLQFGKANWLESLKSFCSVAKRLCRFLINVQTTIHQVEREAQHCVRRLSARISKLYLSITESTSSISQRHFKTKLQLTTWPVSALDGCSIHTVLSRSVTTSWELQSPLAPKGEADSNLEHFVYSTFKVIKRPVPRNWPLWPAGKPTL